jgi:hypothetical protein
LSYGGRISPGNLGLLQQYRHNSEAPESADQFRLLMHCGQDGGSGGMSSYLKKSLDRNTTGPLASTGPSKELTRCSLFNRVAQPNKLIYSLICLHITRAFKIVHRCGADRTPHNLVLIEHREFNDHPIEVVA